MLFCDWALARRIELNTVLELVEYAKIFAQTGLRPEAKWKVIGEGYAVFTGKDLHINRAGNLGMNHPVSAAELDELEEFYGSVGMPAELDFCPFADKSLFQLLTERNYHLDRFLNLYMRELPQDEAPFAPVAGVEVVKIGPEEGQTWALTITQGFSATDTPDPTDTGLAYAETVLHRGPEVACFLAKVGGEPAGGGAVSVRDGVGYLFSASTRPAFRGKGVQKALIEARITFAREQGCGIITTMTVPGNASQRNMERQGFRVAYTRPVMQKHL